jgi:hypothetical protein
MKQLMLLISVAVVTFMWDYYQPVHSGQTINPVLGDISFVSKYGREPTKETDERLRIQTHLQYVAQLLKDRTVSQRSPELKARRSKIIHLLEDYANTGIFPRNYDYTDRRVPCFIDKDGRICAVGYLVEQTAGRPVAEVINSKHKYDELLAMNDPAVDNWIASSGLTKEEAAMIQPTYGSPSGNTGNHITKEYGLTTAITCGVNLSLNTINGMQIANPGHNRVVPVIGLCTGIGQIIYGAANFPKEVQDNSWYYPATTNESQKVLSMINIGLGTTSVILSTWNLLRKQPVKERKVSWNLYSFPTYDNSTGLALGYTRRF